MLKIWYYANIEKGLFIITFTLILYYVFFYHITAPFHEQAKRAIKKQKKRPISELHCISIKLKHLYVEVVFSQMGLVEAWGSGWICG